MGNSGQVHRRLSARLQELRGALGLSLRAAATGLDISPGYLSRIEGRGEIPSADLICQIAFLYEVDPAELLELAKLDQLDTTAQSVDQKHQEALRLYRKRRSDSK